MVVARKNLQADRRTQPTEGHHHRSPPEITTNTMRLTATLLAVLTVASIYALFSAESSAFKLSGRAQEPRPPMELSETTWEKDPRVVLVREHSQVAGHATPRSRAHMPTHKHAHTYTQIDSRSFAPNKLFIVNIPAFVGIRWNSSRTCLMILHKRPKKLLLTINNVQERAGTSLYRQACGALQAPMPPPQVSVLEPFDEVDGVEPNRFPSERYSPHRSLDSID